MIFPAAVRSAFAEEGRRFARMRLRIQNRTENSGRLQCSRGWRYPRPVRRFAEQLLGQQLWCWGQDIKSPQGNLLIEFGFQRHRLRAADSQGSTCYRFDDDQRHIALWGFGLFYGERQLGGLYVGRFDFRPAWANLESLALGIHWPSDLPTFSLPRTNQQWQRVHQLSRRMLGWIASTSNGSGDGWASPTAKSALPSGCTHSSPPGKCRLRGSCCRTARGRQAFRTGLRPRQDFTFDESGPTNLNSWKPSPDPSHGESRSTISSFVRGHGAPECRSARLALRLRVRRRM